MDLEHTAFKIRRKSDGLFAKPRSYGQISWTDKGTVWIGLKALNRTLQTNNAVSHLKAGYYEVVAFKMVPTGKVFDLVREKVKSGNYTVPKVHG